MKDYAGIYRECYRIRCFEKKVEQGFSKGLMRGTTHGCIGQEVIPVIAMREINREIDRAVGTHRCHGQVLAYEPDTYRLACEMMGKRDGFVKGMGGSQHIKTGGYLTNGVTGGMAVIGCGMAMAMQKKKSGGLVLAFIGDGGFNEGYVQESLNLASVYSVPIIYICENNRYAMSTPTTQYSAGDFERRVRALDIHYIQSTTRNVDEMIDAFKSGFRFVREQSRPCFIEVMTARLCGHSKSDEMKYMSEAEIRDNQTKDPLKWLEGLISDTDRDDIRTEIEKEIDDAFRRAEECDEYGLERK